MSGYPTGIEERESKAARILEALGINTAKIRLFLVPMSTDRTAVNKVYDEICKEMAECAGAGQKVSLTAEGDACFYSSAHYIFEKFTQANTLIYPLSIYIIELL